MYPTYYPWFPGMSGMDQSNAAPWPTRQCMGPHTVRVGQQADAHVTSQIRWSEIVVSAAVGALFGAVFGKAFGRLL
jgi:hypothetical protein